MTDAIHLSTDQLVRFLDGEQPPSDGVAARSHLAVCAACRERRDQLAQLTVSIEAAVASAPANGPAKTRNLLETALRFEDARTGRKPVRKTNRYLGWSMVAAATIALGLLLSPMLRQATQKNRAQQPVSQATSIDVNGEDFVALPYSNPDLPMTTPRIVEMRIPVSSLESAGIMTEPLMNRGVPDQTVRANVLLGLDGQPLGIHILSND